MKMEKNKKYNVVLGLMIFFFILFVGVCIAWGLSSIASNKFDSNETDKPEIIGISKEEETNDIEDSVITYPQEVDLQSEEIADVINMLEAKIKYVDPSENYTAELTNNQIIGAAMFFYLNDNSQKEYSEYIYTKDLTPVIKKYFGVENITYGELTGTNYVYFEEKQAYEAPMWGTSTALFINKAEYTNKDTIRVYVDEVVLARFENSEDITKDTYTQDMVENKLIATIKLNEDGSFILSNYGYSEKDLYNK